MADDSQSPSFSRSRRFKIGVGVAITTLAVLASVVMANYLSEQVFHRFYLSSNTRVQLSTRTKSLLHSLTNEVLVTVYFNKDPDDSFYRDAYPDVKALLKEYSSENQKIAVRYLDYQRDPGAAEEFKVKYKLGATTNKNMIVFDCGGKTQFIPGIALMRTQLVPEKAEKPNQIALRRRPVAFDGEILFTGALIGVTSTKPLKAYFLEGHRECDPSDMENPLGYGKFAELLKQNYVQISRLSLLGTNVPPDCNLLVIAGPVDQLLPIEATRIDKYLNQGGRLLALFDFRAAKEGQPTGLEKILASWGVNVSTSIVKDPVYTTSDKLTDVIAACGVRLPDNLHLEHPVIKWLIGSKLRLVLPRDISTTNTAQPDSGLKAEEILFSGPDSVLDPGTGDAAARPMIVAVEKSAAKGVAAEYGVTRIVVAGDSIFLSNECIDFLANRDFAANAVNWLLERPILLEGIAPKPVTEYSLTISRLELRTVRWVLLAAIPGGILMLGGLVWMQRRK